MDVTGVNGSYSSYSSYGRIASGTRVQSAADDAAGLAIAEQEESQARGLNAGTNNAAQSKDMLNVADGALGNISDSLQRMRELAVQASNGLLTNTDRGNIQAEIDELKKGIADVAGNTTFNTKNILDGDQTEFNLATDANGGSRSVRTADGTLASLGIEDFDVTSGDFDITKLDDAISFVNSQRGGIGAQTNGLENTIAYNNYAAQNTIGSQSRIEDLDMETAVSDQKKKELLDTYAIMMQKRQQEDEQAKNAQLFQ